MGVALALHPHVLLTNQQRRRQAVPSLDRAQSDTAAPSDNLFTLALQDLAQDHRAVRVRPVPGASRIAGAGDTRIIAESARDTINAVQDVQPGDVAQLVKHREILPALERGGSDKADVGLDQWTGQRDANSPESL